MKILKWLVILLIFVIPLHTKINSNASFCNGQYYLNAPTASLPSGVYYQHQSVSLYTEYGAALRYTLDGTEPNEYSLTYSSPITIYNSTIIKAKTYQYGYWGPTLTLVYTIINQETNDIQINVYYEYPRLVNRYAETCMDNLKYQEAKKAIEDILPKYSNEIYLYDTLARVYKNFYADGIKIFVYGNEIDFSQYDYVYPKIIDGRTLIPIRALSESMGASVDWNYSERKATIYFENKVIEITTDSSAAKVNGTTCWLDVPARIINDRLMVPLRFVSENFGKEVNWFTFGEDGSIISITD